MVSGQAQTRDWETEETANAFVGVEAKALGLSGKLIGMIMCDCRRYTRRELKHEYSFSALPMHHHLVGVIQDHPTAANGMGSPVSGSSSPENF